jgi:phosphopantothenoylcysteine decarboxylase/phosphopantothenate--cysteine ligase
MGAAVAVAAWLRGARVHVVQGPVDLWLPNGIEVVDVTSARQMFEAAVDLWPDMDVAVCTAAVADFAPAEPSDHKFKKATQESGITLKMSPTPDILAHLGASKSGHQKLCGFAAETSGLEAALEDKLGRKNCDLMVGNLVNVPGAGFAGPDNQVSVLEASGRFEQWPPLPKTEVAWRIWDMIADTA